MSQAPNPFTQAASQGYGDFAATLDDEDQDENNEEQQIEDELEGPESPEPEEQETDEIGFTQTQERSYPTGIESPDEDDNEEQNEISDHEPEQEDNDEEAGPSSPPAEDSNDQQQEVKEEEGEEEEKQESENDEDSNKKQSQSLRRVKIMDDSDNDDEQPTESTSTVNKDKNRNFLKQMTMKNDESQKKHKKRRSDEHHHHHHHHHHEHKSKRFRKTSNDEEVDQTEEPEKKKTKTAEATSDVEDVVDDIFGNAVNDNDEEVDDRQEAAAELADLNDDEAVQEPEEEEEDEDNNEEQQTFDTQEEDDEGTLARKASNAAAKNSNITYDIDLYLERKAEKRRGNRRRGGKNGDIDLGPDDDQFVSKLIDQMKIATEEDRIFNKSRQPATAKLLMLPAVEQHLCRADLTEIFLDNGILTVFKDWLSPLPDKSLPNTKIREALIKILQQFGTINADALRDSGIGRSLMYLYKHPRETKENKIKLIKIIHDWARPIFNLDTDYKLLTREERLQRDVDQATLKRQTSLTGKPKNRRADVDLPFSSDGRQDDDDELNNDDDCPRARVPRPSNKDYIIRPASTAEYPEKRSDGKKRTVSRLDAIKRQQQDRKRNSKPMSIVKLSIEGNKMHL
ncbi:unnamed protein product [Rotaria socialis]|uniref:TFIIS N-terminal domain-containing protein n=1 Tax=Rotaria socialis TaxID=392032 RepID=A0A820U6W6_9BILA|nr:unnamed protein product [Rotaria socialis]CAF3494871.1 unnamed protein product [Rotaria socialis]CAF3579278.1 unnamed protein product [Rotaria socialis]CAF4171117.1 unnamed protein product [Rotaria socialis]CAF4398845.1 unnamed protein product [Rotaria socialis]